MKPYLSFFRIRFLAGLQYRSAAWSGCATQFAWGFLRILLFRAFYDSDPSAFPMSFAQLSTYIWLQQALLALFMGWYFDGEILNSIATGDVAYELCRPCDLYTMWFTKNLAVRVSRAVLRCLPILLVGVLLPAPYGILVPPTVGAGVLFVLSVVLGSLVVVAFSMLIYTAAFYTVSPGGVRALATSLVELLAGGILPIPFFPEAVQKVLNLLPFASMQNVPFLIYIGHTDGREALLAVGLQVFWLLVLAALGRGWMDRAVRRVVVQGG